MDEEGGEKLLTAEFAEKSMAGKESRFLGLRFVRERTESAALGMTDN